MTNMTLLSEQDQQSVSYFEIEQQTRITENDTYGVLFISCAHSPANFGTQIRSILESQSGLTCKCWSGKEQESMFILMPGQALDAVHYHALILKRRLKEMMSGLDMRMTIASCSEQDGFTEQLLSQMEESAQHLASGEIHIFTREDMQTLQSRILIVEGDAAVREFLEIRLNMQGYETMIADNGLSALDLIGSWQPDLILTELNLYGIDGLPYIHQIQQLDLPKLPKIIVLSEQRVEQTISLCFQNGVDDYVTKPFSPLELDARIRRCVY